MSAGVGPIEPTEPASDQDAVVAAEPRRRGRAFVVVAALLVIAGGVLIITLGMRDDPPPVSGSEAYYGGYVGKDVPYRPTDPLSDEEITTRQVYYVARFGEKSRLRSFMKLAHGTRAFTDTYSYWPNGKLKRRLTVEADGTRIVQHYDELGRLSSDPPQEATVPSGKDTASRQRK